MNEIALDLYALSKLIISSPSRIAILFSKGFALLSKLLHTHLCYFLIQLQNPFGAQTSNGDNQECNEIMLIWQLPLLIGKGNTHDCNSLHHP